MCIHKDLLFELSSDPHCWIMPEHWFVSVTFMSLCTFIMNCGHKCVCLCTCMHACTVHTMINYGVAPGQWHHLTARVRTAQQQHCLLLLRRSINSLELLESIKQVGPPDVNVNLTIHTRTRTHTHTHTQNPLNSKGSRLWQASLSC